MEKQYNIPTKVNYLFRTLRDDRKFMYDELLSDGWRYNKEGEVKYSIANSKLIKEFDIIFKKEEYNDESDVRNYFKTKYSKYRQGCSCDECMADYELEYWSEILHGEPLNNK